MSVTHSGGRQPHRVVQGPQPALGLRPPRPTLVNPGFPRANGSAAEFSFIDLGQTSRAVLMLTPPAVGGLKQQVQAALSALETALSGSGHPMTVTSQTVFLREASHQAVCAELFASHYGTQQPVTSYVLQPPCSGAELGLEAWAIGGKPVRLERFGPQTLAIGYDELRWVHCGGFSSSRLGEGVYQQTQGVLRQLRQALVQAGSGFEQVVRTWFYLGGITEPAHHTQCYKEFNRARTDFYEHVRFSCSVPIPNIPQGIYPASTGIGMAGTDLVAACLALQTRRKDAHILPLENPHQTPAYAYHPKYSPQSPKFSRAKALILDKYITTWVSGTASVVHSESCHEGDVEKQTARTIDNIEQLLTPDNFAFHGVRGAGAALQDLAKIRVYLKRPEDFPKCKAICDRRFGPIPAMYVVADICRPELLVEIEGVAFSPYSPT